MDYVFGQVLRFYQTLILILGTLFLSYDIVCQWSINWQKRFTHAGASLGRWAPAGLQIQKAIGQWHIHGHKALCLARYGFTFIPGAGQQDGEVVETMWSYLNGLAATARAMTKGHREESLNDGFNNWNWKKLMASGW